MSATITIAGWWAWNGFMSAAYSDNLSPYDVRHGFANGFGKDPMWWLTLLLAFAALTILELGWKTLRSYLGTLGIWERTGRGWGKWARWVGAEEDETAIWQVREGMPGSREIIGRRVSANSVSDLSEDKDVEEIEMTDMYIRA